LTVCAMPTVLVLVARAGAIAIIHTDHNPFFY
jgi:hypothetical protein